MYNRYIPQADGTYRRNRIPGPPPPEAPASPPEQQDCRPEETERQAKKSPPPPECREQPQKGCHRGPRPPIHPPCREPRREENCSDSGLGFLRNLLPRDFDTGDLLIILLLLLMSGDCKEEQNTALLTLALYLFL